MFYGVSWEGVSLRQFISILDSYLHWYNRERIKQSLGWRSPMDFRRSLGADLLIRFYIIWSNFSSAAPLEAFHPPLY